MKRWLDILELDTSFEKASGCMAWGHMLKWVISTSRQFIRRMYEELLAADPKDFVVRVERDALRRLHKSGATVFTKNPTFYSDEEIKA